MKIKSIFRPCTCIFFIISLTACGSKISNSFEKEKKMTPGEIINNTLNLTNFTLTGTYPLGGEVKVYVEDNKAYNYGGYYVVIEDGIRKVYTYDTEEKAWRYLPDEHLTIEPTGDRYSLKSLTNSLFEVDDYKTYFSNLSINSDNTINIDLIPGNGRTEPPIRYDISQIKMRVSKEYVTELTCFVTYNEEYRSIKHEFKLTDIGTTHIDIDLGL